MTYKIELKKTKRMGHVQDRIFLSWLKYGIAHITTSFDEATEFRKRDLERIEKRFGGRIILYTKRKGGKEWKKQDMNK